MDGIPFGLRSLAGPKVRGYDLSTGRITYVAGYEVTDIRQDDLIREWPHLTKVDYTAEDLKDMSMREYASARRNYGSSIRTGGNLFSTLDASPVKTKTTFDMWCDAREAYISGAGDLDTVLRCIRLEDGDKYDELVLKEIEKEKKEKHSEAHQHRFRWCRWFAWRWLVAWNR